MTKKTTGVLLSVTGAFILSFDILAVRWINMDYDTVLFWRGVFFTFGFAGVVMFRYRQRCVQALVESQWLGVVTGFCFAANTYCYIQAIQQTSAAAAMMIINTTPIFTVIICRLWLKECIRSHTVVVIIMTIIGIAIISADSGTYNRMSGNLFALGCAVLMAVSVSVARYKSTLDLTPGLIYSGLFLVLFVLMGDRTPAVPDTTQFGVMALTGLLIVPAGLTLLLIAPRYISATDVSLIVLLQAVLGPLWVWLALNERPTITTLLGCIIICTALLGHVMWPVNRLNKKQRHDVSQIAR